MATLPNPPKPHICTDLDIYDSPSADYGLDDGFDPLKYDFYNPATRTAPTTYVLRLDEHGERQSVSEQQTTSTPPVNPYEITSPPPLSPIQELEDDDADSIRPRARSTLDYRSYTEEDGTVSVDLDEPVIANADGQSMSLEKRSELLFCRQHLQIILADQKMSVTFAEFLHSYRPDSVPILAYYLNAIKALRSILYAESIIANHLEPIIGHGWTSSANNATLPFVIEDKADRALDVLVTDDLPGFIAYSFVKTVDVALKDRVTGRRNSTPCIADGLAEVFVISDPARVDNPIVFSSEEFHRMTGYTRREIIGYNCRLLGGKSTSTSSTTRFRASLDAQREHCEILLNYKRDGSPFVNLIMCVPLRDQSNKVRYYLGAQLDITSLLDECVALDSFRKLLDQQGKVPNERADAFEQLSEVFSVDEVQRLAMLRLQQTHHKAVSVAASEREQADSLREVPLEGLHSAFELSGPGSVPPLGFYQNYLLVRPSPSLRILFASPDLRLAGILQSPLLSCIGGSSKIREDLAHALEVGRKVTAKVQWLSSPSLPKAHTQTKWIHCTPLLGVNNNIGVWMVILIDGEQEIPFSAANKDPAHSIEALPWDASKSPAQVTKAAVKPVVRDGDRSLKGMDPLGSDANIKRNSLPEDAISTPSSTERPALGPRIGGKSYSFRNRGIIMDDDDSINGQRSRPTSQDNSTTSLQHQMQPTIRIAGRASTDTDSAKKLPINMPGLSKADEQDRGNARPPRRSYKSLSPYGILFDG